MDHVHEALHLLRPEVSSSLDLAWVHAHLHIDVVANTACLCDNYKAGIRNSGRFYAGKRIPFMISKKGVIPADDRPELIQLQPTFFLLC